MTDNSKIKAIYEAIENSAESRSRGRLACTISALILSAFPWGGPASLAMDKLGAKLADPNIEHAVVALAKEIEARYPDISAIADFEKRLSALQSKLGEFESMVRAAVSAAAESAKEVFEVNTSGGIFELENTVIRNMHLLSSAKDGGLNTFNQLQHQGSAKFNTDRSSIQKLTNSEFHGKSHGVETQVSFGDVTLGTGTVETNAVIGGGVVGLRLRNVHSE